MSVDQVDFRPSPATIFPSPSYDPRRRFCPAGHDKFVVGIAPNKQCRECRRTQQRHQARWHRSLVRTNRRVDAAIARLEIA